MSRWDGVARRLGIVNRQFFMQRWGAEALEFGFQLRALESHRARTSERVSGCNMRVR
jgi:hypothetical protein